MPQDVASRAAEQAKGKAEFTSAADDACDSLCRTGRTTKRHTQDVASRAAEQAKGKAEFTSATDDACDSLCRTGRTTKRHPYDA